MSIPPDLCQLLDKAKAITGSDYATAKAIGVARQHLSNWRNGSRECSPEDVAQLAEVAGLEAEKWFIRATLKKHEGTPKGDRLYKALGKSLLLTGVALVSSGAAAQQIFLIKPVVYFIRCILC
ncbi:MAG: helix-turn-helix transcriptional regulator [Polynucleobacter sp.]|uniref:helix-turn-helix domain-containing protein n=1 Tax=Polynucleobacter sp. TaxID=2029855 RepID=UPI002727A340|nr:helix-turn-helix transcriptional regulator [Polynucleobacter sp.]MDO8713143.1 helix-turn-helix transcriptional regulator [Polynucleobacter sp.]